MEELYWSTFYQCPDESIQGPSLFAKNVGSWLVSKYSANDVNILELGCGNCRDSCYLSELGYKVTAVDTAVQATVEDNLTKKKRMSSTFYVKHKTRITSFTCVGFFTPSHMSNKKLLFN